MPLKVGLTGGIGSGKTTVSNRFQELGIPVIDTDIIAHELVKPGSTILQHIVDDFGQDVLQKDHNLDRGKLRTLVFNDPTAKQRLEAILHPAIKQQVIEQLESIDCPYCIIVVPLLIETDFVNIVDRILIIEAPEHKRIEWLKSRGLQETEIKNIMSSQASSAERLEKADDIIYNDGSLTELAQQVDTLHQHYNRIAQELNAKHR